MHRRQKIKCRIISNDSFVERGIMSVLMSAGYEILSPEESEGDRDCEVALLCFDRQNCTSHADLCASLPQQCKLVVLAQPHDRDALPPQTLACAAAVLDRSVSQQKLLVTLDAVMMGAVVRDTAFFRPNREPSDIVFPVESARTRLPVKLPPPPGSDTFICPFSLREQEILSVLAEGVSNKHIARKFDIAESTVKVHVKHILRKLNMNNRTQAAIWAKSYRPIPV